MEISDLKALLNRPIAFHRVFVDIAGSITAGLMLSQAWYWTQHTSNPDGWFWKTEAQWTEETGLTRFEQEGARKVLRRLGLIREERRGMPAKLFYRVDFEAVCAAINARNKTVCGKPADKHVENQQTSLRKSSRQACGKSANKSAENQQAIYRTETTTETTSEITTEKDSLRPSEEIPVVSEKSYPNFNEQAREAFDYWRDRLTHPDAKFTEDRKRKIIARLREGYTLEQIKRGIDGCAASSFHRGENETHTPYDDLELICRSGSKLEGFIARANGNGGSKANGSVQTSGRENRTKSPARSDNFVFNPKRVIGG